MLETIAMAKAGKKAAADAEPRPLTSTVARPTALTIKGNLAWRGWVERGAKHCRTDVAKLVDASLVKFLQDQGFTEPPPER